ncbi:MAG TPA: T9SS type A sorting domain-containing protein [Bacteroidia bacterium]|nr:T9SS type A sorting domain-containing protein [Bacteroidia bacterium]
MKRSLLFLFLLPAVVTAQNWSPLNLTDKYNYRLGNDPVITQTVWQNGFSAVAGDTVFTLNDIMCDTCLTWTSGPLACDSCYGLLHVAQFEGKQVKQFASGWCNFRDPGSKTIDLFAALNDTWLFDTLNNVTAQVIFAGNSVVLGNADSVKTLLLSTGDTLCFSKDYGIVQWPHGYGQNSYYRLAGIQGRNIGVLIPRMMNYFDFAVGDIFQYQGRINSGASPQVRDFIRKYIITGKTVNGDTVRYTVQGHMASQCEDVISMNFWMEYSLINETYTFIDSANHTGNQFNNCAVDGFLRVIPNSGGMGQPQNSFNPAPGWYRCSLYMDPFGNKGIRFGTATSYTDFHIDPSCSVPVFAGSDTLQPVSWGDAFTVQLTEGLGQTFALWTSNFEGSWSEQLTAFRKNGDTTGVLIPDNQLDALAQHPGSGGGMTVYPNPADEALIISLPGNVQADLVITDAGGRVVFRQQNAAGNIQLATADLAEGMYFLRVITAQGAAAEKIVIRH